MRTLAVRELIEASRRVDSPALLEGLPDLGLAPQTIVDDVDAARPQR